MKLVFLLCIVLVACIACKQPFPKETIRICDENGCVERPRDYSSYDSSKEFPDEDPDGRIAALKALGEKDARAAYDLGLRFFRGDGIPQDSYQALIWMRKAAKSGDLDAQKALGGLYLTGLEETGPDPNGASLRVRSMIFAAVRNHLHFMPCRCHSLVIFGPSFDTAGFTSSGSGQKRCIGHCVIQVTD